MLDAATPDFTPIRQLGEFALIDRLAQVLGRPTSPDLLTGIGDDAAVIRLTDERALVWTSDLLTEGVHFDPSYAPLQHVGFKALAVNASDIYAMNARPRFALLALAISERYSVEALELLYTGLRDASHAYGIELVGGDTTASKSGLVLTLTVMGEAPPERIVRRSGGRPTDLLVVSGNLGAAYAGLQVLEREKAVWLQNPHIQPDLSDADYVVERQLRPRARRDIYEWLAAADLLPTSMIDVSDGLASEIWHLCTASQTGALVYADRIPIDYQTQRTAEAFGLGGLGFALQGGEDYELLFTLPVAAFDRIRGLNELHIIGHLTEAERGIHLAQPDGSIVPLEPIGHDHFRA